MNVDLGHIRVVREDTEPVSFEKSMDPAELDIAESEAVYDKNIILSGELFFCGGQLNMRVRISGRLKRACSRCLTEFVSDFENEASFSFETSSSKFINTLPEISEELRSDAPIHALCDDGCKGLCPQCGKNLNEAACNCKPDR